MKEFQVQLAGKEKEIQEAVQDAIEAAQKDERRLVTEYEEQITELQRELLHREQEMLDFRTESEHGLRELQEEFNTLEASHQDQVTKLEQDYHGRLDELVKRHEQEVCKRNFFYHGCFLSVVFRTSTVRHQLS